MDYLDRVPQGSPDDDCHLCHGLQIVPDARWEAFFADNPDISALICSYFGVNHWMALPHLTAVCPECYDTGDDDFPF